MFPSTPPATTRPVSASRAGATRGTVVLAEQRRAWDAGHCDACIDLRGPASVCRLEPECVRS
jgi:hypothetical protein